MILEISLFIDNWLTETLYIVINLPDWDLSNNQLYYCFHQGNKGGKSNLTALFQCLCLTE